MTAYNDDDVAAGGNALHSAWGLWWPQGLDLLGEDAHQYLTRAILDAVAPQIAARARADERSKCRCRPANGTWGPR